MSVTRRLSPLALVLAVAGTSAAAGPTPEELFRQRIMPIFKSPDPSSCVQCHLAGVDLKNYILPSSEKTFLSLRDQGLVDLDRPGESKILTFIDRHEGERDGPNLIHEERREAERKAFAAWLAACCADPKLRSAPELPAGELANPGRDPEVIRFARKDRVFDSFVQNVWSLRFRCVSCHQEGGPNTARIAREWGDHTVWVKSTPMETMNHLIRETDLIDVDNPKQSLLLLKPLNAVKHQGGIKFEKRHSAYRMMRTWLEDYAAVARDRYKTSADLPETGTELRRFAGKQFLKFSDAPPEWFGKMLQINVYAWDSERGAWEPGPVAKGDNVVLAKPKMWQSELTLLAEPGSERARRWAAGEATLPPGRYRIRVFVDREDRLAGDWRAEMRPEDFVGETTFQGRWPVGFQVRPTIPAARIRE